MKTLREALAEYAPQMLRAIAETNQLELPDGATREQWAAHLAAELARPEVVGRAWESLSEAERRAIERMLLQGGRVKAFQMLRDYGEIRAFGPVALARDKPWLSPQNTSERLWYRGLIQRAFDVVGDFRGEIFFVPEEIAAHLPKPAPEVAAFSVTTVGKPDSITDAGDRLVWDMFKLLAFVAREEPPLGDGTLFSDADLRHLASQLMIGDRPTDKALTEIPRLLFVVHLARTAHLIKPIKDVGVRLGAEAKNWLRGTGQSRRLQLFEAWKRERAWNELRYVPSLKVEETGWHNDPRLAREAVIKYLAQCPLDMWIALSAFIASVKKLDPDFQRPDGDYERWHIRDAKTGRLLTGFSSWNQVEGALLTFMFEGPLTWLGIVRTGEQEGASASFQITAFGARALGLTHADLPEPATQRFIVQGDFDVLVPEAAPLYARFQLERMTERVRWDRISTYHLSRESVTRLLRHQVGIDQILAFLKRISREPFPKNVEYSLREWAAKYGEITLRRAAILHTRNKNLLVELQHHPELKSYILEVLSPTVALVQPERLEELQSHLEVLGYSPKVEVVS